MGEFELIRRFFLPLGERQESGSLILGPGDDCAIQRIPAGRDLVFSVDFCTDQYIPVDITEANTKLRNLKT